MKAHGVTTVVCLSLTAGSALGSTASAGTGDASVDVTAHIEMLGNPYQAKYPSGPRIYARTSGIYVPTMARCSSVPATAVMKARRQTLALCQ